LKGRKQPDCRRFTLDAAQQPALVRCRFRAVKKLRPRRSTAGEAVVATSYGIGGARGDDSVVERRD
jgi:hypothetical protein